MQSKESKRIQKLRDSLAEKILKKISGCTVNSDLSHSLPNILNISIDGVESDALVLYLDAVGIAVSGKSACKSSDSVPSHVILAVKGKREGIVRFSLGRGTTGEDIARVVGELARIVPLLRESRAQSDAI